jgi:hypothetical protein
VATARERLLQALTAIISQPFSDEGKTALKRLLNAYRVQAKPGEASDKNQTARDTLADMILHSWQQNGQLDRKGLSQLISPFRMQLKQGLSRGRLLTNKSGSDGTNAKEHLKNLTRTQIKENTAKHENAYFKDKFNQTPPNLENAPIAGGPKQASNTRGQCPKCRSAGIVLARAYGGDDYYSCIYCGFQSYLKGADPKLDLPLAAELLGHAFSDPDRDNED